MEAECFRSFARFDLGGRKSVIAAISGGSDSIALLYLLKSFIQQIGCQTRIVAVTIDHGLRAESADEADYVARLCAGEQIIHKTMAWTGDKPRTGMPGAAREARYRLLREAAREFGSDLILTGHTRDDQAETVAMRRKRGEGIGLAGMAPVTLYDGDVWIVRPLLDASRQQLRDHLRARGVRWLDDPTNSNPHYERARLRAARNPVETDSRGAADTRKALAKRAAELVRKHVTLVGHGLVRIDPEMRSIGDRAAAIHMLRILLAVIGGRAFLPDHARVSSLHARLDGNPLRATLSRTVVDARRAGLFLHREGRGLPGPAPASSGLVWDGRYRIVMQRASGEMDVGPFGRDNALTARVVVAGAPESLLRAALAAEPAFWRGGEVVGLAREQPDMAIVQPLMAPWQRFLSGFDIDAARAAGRLIGAPSLPQPPCARHNIAKP